MKRKSQFWKRSTLFLIIVLGLVLFFVWEDIAGFKENDIFSNFKTKIKLLADKGKDQAFSFSNSSRIGPKNFSEAKQAARRLYSDHRNTFYCGCKYDKHGKIDLRSCGYKIQKDRRRASRVEWEHIVPVSQMSSHLPCWKNKLCSKGNGERYQGRQCCREKDKDFARMEADLHNLVPEIGELNACRSNFRFGMLGHIKEGQFGACQFKVDKDTRRVEPKPVIRGTIARAYLYIKDTYHLSLSDSQLQLFNAWNKQYPPDAWEIERDKRIAKIQGNHNPYIRDYARNTDI